MAPTFFYWFGGLADLHNGVSKQQFTDCVTLCCSYFFIIVVHTIGVFSSWALFYYILHPCNHLPTVSICLCCLLCISLTKVWFIYLFLLFCCCCSLYPSVFFITLFLCLYNLFVLFLFYMFKIKCYFPKAYWIFLVHMNWCSRQITVLHIAPNPASALVKI